MSAACVALLLGVPLGIAGPPRGSAGDPGTVGPVTSAAASTPRYAWPSYLHDPLRSGYNSADKALTGAVAATLAPVWEYKTGGFVATSAVAAMGRIFVGSWDGYEYSLNSSSGELVWRTYLNVTNDSRCPGVRGISSTPTVVGTTMYLGGGDEYWYALNASTGNVLWKVYVGNNSANSGHYNWASPLIYRDWAYIGISSNCDSPLVQGGLLQVNLTSHAVVHVFNTSNTSAHGASVWGSPTVDPRTNLVYFATGNGGRYGDSVIAVNATTLALNGSWSVPKNQTIWDGDFGNTPTLFLDRQGDRMVGVASKNGIFYAFNDSRISDGPIWEVAVARGGDCPECGQGSISPAAFDGRKVFVAGGVTSLGGIAYPGSVRALDPRTGAILWEHGSPAAILAGLATVRGLVIAASSAGLEVLNSTSGQRVLNYPTAKPLWAAPTVVGTSVFVSSVAGTVLAFGPSNGSWQKLYTPPPLANASLAYDPGDGYTVLFGGCGPQHCPSGSTYRWIHDTWADPTPPSATGGLGPSPRLDAGLAYDAADGYLLLFGGYAPGVGDLADSWSFHAGIWTKLATNGSPPARSAMGLVYDPVDGVVVLFGGSRHLHGHIQELSDTWTYSNGIWNWTHGIGHVAPTGRHGTAVTFDPALGTVVLFGGRANSTTLNDTWSYVGRQWVPIVPAAAPPAVYGGALVFDPASARDVLIDGRNVSGGFFASTWAFAVGNWSPLPSLPHPDARAGLGAAYDEADGYTVIYGGMDRSGAPLSDTWRFNGTNWSHEFPVSPGGARAGAAAAYDPADGYVVIFGGAGPTSTLRADTLEFDGSRFVQACLGCRAGTTAPMARAFGSMAYDSGSGRVVLFGGNGSAGPLGDTWAFSHGRWTNLTPATPNASNSPSPRQGAAFAEDPRNGYLLLFGGSGANGTLNDSWAFDGANWTRLNVSVAPSPREGAAVAYDGSTGGVVLFGGRSNGSDLGDTWVFASGLWNPLNESVSPSPRSFASMANDSDPAIASPILFGGRSNGSLSSEVWRFQQHRWVEIFRSGVPGPRAAAVLVYDPGRDQLILYAGAAPGAGLLSVTGDSWRFSSAPL